MSIDALQEKIRKLKNPSMVDLTVLPEQLPAVVTEGRGELDAYAQFCRQIMAALKGTVPAVRFSFDHFALLDGLPVLKDLLNVDIDLWKQEVAGIKEFYSKFGDKLPAELIHQLSVLEGNLN